MKLDHNISITFPCPNVRPSFLVKAPFFFSFIFDDHDGDPDAAPDCGPFFVSDLLVENGLDNGHVFLDFGSVSACVGETLHLQGPFDPREPQPCQALDHSRLNCHFLLRYALLLDTVVSSQVLQPPRSPQHSAFVSCLSLSSICLIIWKPGFISALELL